MPSSRKFPPPSGAPSSREAAPGRRTLDGFAREPNSGIPAPPTDPSATRDGDAPHARRAVLKATLVAIPTIVTLRATPAHARGGGLMGSLGLYAYDDETHPGRGRGPKHDREEEKERGDDPYGEGSFYGD